MRSRPYADICQSSFLFWTLGSLLLGSLIYILFRSPSLKVFEWLENVGLYESTNVIRTITTPLYHYIPEYILFSLPDGLWVFSYLCLILHLWSGKISTQNIGWIIITPVVAIGSEIGQFFWTYYWNF